MSEQDGRQASTIQRPTSNDIEAWKEYWKALGQPWRTDPEIDAERQKYLAERRNITPAINQGIYPFKDMKLSRADVEWLLATHENGRGPVDWEDKSQRNRKGLDLRGTDLSQEDLSGLPLACMQGGLTPKLNDRSDEKQRNMATAHMKKADLHGALLQGANLCFAQLQQADLDGAQLQEANLEWAEMQEANLLWTEMQQAHLHGAQLQKALLGGAKLRDASLHSAQLQGVFLSLAQLDGVDLRGATLADETYGPPQLADVMWGEINLAVVDWTSVKMLGDEHLAHQKKDSEGETRDKQSRVDQYKEAVRANRQLAVVLRDQGLNEEADHFAYRAQLLQRKVWQLQRRPLKFLLSWFLYLLAGYGYRPMRSLIAYIVIIFVFMGLYLINAHFVALLVVPHLTWDEALVLSVSSFHGRGFFTQNVTLGDTYARLAAVEAIIGLFIEISFIATFTQRFFGK